MKKAVSFLALSFLLPATLSAQWNTVGNNSSTGTLTVGPVTVQGTAADSHNAGNVMLLNTDSKNAWQLTNRKIDQDKFQLHRFSFAANEWLTPFTVTMEGKIGIGTSAPSARLHLTSRESVLYTPGEPANSLLWIGGKNDVFDNQFINFRNPATSDNSGLHWWSPDIIFGREKNSAIWGFKETHGNPSGTGSLGKSRKDIIRAELTDDGGYNYLTKLILAPTEGHVGIGTTSPDAKLTVKGNIHAEEVKVDLRVPGPDYVFAADYQLPSLAETERFIKDNKHLPEVPSAKEMEQNGIDVGTMNMLLLKKVEELTLYVIDLQKQVKGLKNVLPAVKEKE